MTHQPAIETTSIPTLTTQDVQETDNNFKTVWRTVSTIILAQTFLIPIIIIAMSYWFHKRKMFKGCDKPNYFSTLKACLAFDNLLADSTFVVLLYLEQSDLLIWALICTSFPHFISCMACFHWVTHSGMNNPFSDEYIQKHGTLLIGLSIIGGFYAAVSLSQSKLLYLDIFSLQLKPQQSIKIQRWKFYNVVLLENIPQICIQILYLSQSSFTNGGTNAITMLALMLNVLSVFINVLIYVSRLLRHRSSGDIVDFQVEIKCDFLKEYHKFGQKKVMKILARHLHVPEYSVYSYCSKYNHNVAGSKSIQFYGEIEFEKDEIVANGQETFFESVSNVNQVDTTENTAIRQDIWKKFNLNFCTIKDVYVKIEIKSHEVVDTGTIHVKT